MNKKNIKALVTAIFVLPLVFAAFIGTAAEKVEADAQDAAALYKKNTCFACHKADASKSFDPEKSDEHHINAILKGVKGEKPPYMPAYETKGIDEAAAAALVAHMRELRAAAGE